MVVRVFAADPLRFLSGETTDTLFGLEMVFHPECFTARVHPLISVRAEAVKMAVSRRNAAIAEQPGELVRRLR